MNQVMKIAALVMFSIAGFLAPESYGVDNNDTDKGFWMEVWSNTSYRSTHFSLETPKQEDFYLSNTAIDIGFRFPLSDRVSVDPYLTLELAHDLGNESWNQVYWNNNYQIGPGLRLRYDYNDDTNKKGSVVWLKSMNIGPFIEYLYYKDSPDSAKDEIPETVPDENWRSGISSWVSLDSRKHGRFGPWAELWTELSYNHNNFSNGEYNDYYPFLFQPRIGVEWRYDHIAIQPYLMCDLTYDFGNNSWNKESWLNKLEYGPGIRISIGGFQQLSGTVVHIYTEYLSIDYFSRVDQSAYADNASNDFRIGIKCWLPFGATKKSSTRK